MNQRKDRKAIEQPINQIFKFYVSREIIEFWIFNRKDKRIQGRIMGFDEYMNFVLDEAVEVKVSDPEYKVELGKILLKGDNISLVRAISAS